MLLTLVFSLLVFAAVAVGIYAIWNKRDAQADSLAQRLRELRRNRGAGPDLAFAERPPMLLELVARLGGFLPASEGRDAMRTGLVRAGYRRANAPLVLLGSKLLLAAALPLLWIVVAYATAWPVGNIVRGTVLFAVVGFYLPTMFIAMRRSRRHNAIVGTLPDSLDLLVVCAEAGLGIGAALQRVAGEMRVACPVLSEELSLVNQEMQTGISRTDALRNLAVRTGVEDLYALVAMLIQTDRLGTSIAQALRVHAESMRTRRRQRAEKMARQAAIKLTFPLVFLILPALLVTILGPAAIELVKALVNNN